MPVIIAPIAVATMWRWMYDPFFGLFNAALTALGLAGPHSGLARRPQHSALLDVHRLRLADRRLLARSVPRRSAGRLPDADGGLAHRRRRPLSGVPLCDPAGAAPRDHHRPILSIINSLKAFDIVYGMTGGGPAQSTQMLALWAFTQAMQLGDFGRGAAISVVLLLITIAIVIPYLRWTRGRQETGGMNALRRGLSSGRVSIASTRCWWSSGRAHRGRGDLDRSLRLHRLHLAQGQLDGDGIERLRAADQPRMGQLSPAPGLAADFSTTVFNSAVITIIKVPLGLFISAMAAYALSRIRLPAAGRSSFSSCSARCCRSR